MIIKSCFFILFCISDAGTWSFNSMNAQNYDEITRSPEKQLNVPANPVSWNPDSIDATANPNKGRKITTEKENRIGRMSTTTTERHEIKIESEPPRPPKSQQSVKSIAPGIKDDVMKSDDYKKWLEMKNSFLFQPASTETTTGHPTSIAAPVSRWVLCTQDTN